MNELKGGKRMKKIMTFAGCFLMILLCNSISACTVFNYTQNNNTLVGRNMDWNTEENYIIFFPSEGENFGRVYFGWGSYPSWYMGGMNDQGVMFAYLQAPYLEVKNSVNKPVYEGNYGNLMEKCMEECSSLSDVLVIFDQYNLQFLERGQIMVVDREGNSAIIGGDDITMKKGSYQVVTNFRPSNPQLGGYPCWRYTTAKIMLKQMNDLSIDYFTQICNQTHEEGTYPTIWSIVYDLHNYNIHLFHYHDYNHVIIFNLMQELEQGEHIYSIPSLFEPDNNLPPYKPNKPLGETSGISGREYHYTSLSTDPNGNDIYFQWDWGDEIGEWIGPINSEFKINTPHSWDNENEFEIRVRTKDIYGAESEWSDPLEVSMPKSINIFNPWLFRLIQRFPILDYFL